MQCLRLVIQKHFNPVSLYPELRDYTIYIDGTSKCFAATGVRVGWSFGPTKVIDRMKALLTHVGLGRQNQNNKPCMGNFLDNTPAVK